MRKFVPLLLFLILLNISVSASKKIDRELPHFLAAEKIRPLRQLVNKNLQKELEKQLKQNKIWARLIGKKKWRWVWSISAILLISNLPVLMAM